MKPTTAAQPLLRAGMDPETVRETVQQERDSMCDAVRWYAHQLETIGAELESEPMVKIAGRMHAALDSYLKREG